MNHSMVTADRNTHIKVVVLALVAAIVGVVIGFNAGVDHSGERDCPRRERRARYQGEQGHSIHNP